MKKLSTANLLSIHVLILKIFVFGGATKIVGAGSRQSQIGLFKGLCVANPLPGASGLGKLNMFFGRALDHMGQKCQYLASFGPKILFGGKLLVSSYQGTNETPLSC